MNCKKMKNLFLRQSCLDSWTDYENSLAKPSFIKWDYLVLTASNEEQARTYREQIDHRLAQGRLPADTHYAVLPDPEAFQYVVQEDGRGNIVETGVGIREQTADVAQSRTAPDRSDQSGILDFLRILDRHQAGQRMHHARIHKADAHAARHEHDLLLQSQLVSEE